MLTTITKSQFIDWRSNPVTKEFLNHLWEVRADILEAWTSGSDVPDERVKGMAQAISIACDYAVVGMNDDIIDDSKEDNE